MCKDIIPYSPQKIYKSPQIHKTARKHLKELGIPPEDLFKRDDCFEILRYMYTNPVTKWLKPLPMLQQRSGEQFKRRGHKYSVVFQQLVQSGKGELRLVVLKLPRLTFDSPELNELGDLILSNPLFANLVAIWNIQRGQGTDSFHIHLLVFVPFDRKFGTDLRIKVGRRYFTVQNDVEFGQGEYEGQSTEVGIRRSVQYLNNPHDQRYRIPDWSDKKMEVYKEALLDDLEHLRTKEYKPFPKLKGESKGMERLVKALDSQDASKELQAYLEFQKEKKLQREVKEVQQELATETQPNPTSFPDSSYSTQVDSETSSYPASIFFSTLPPYVPVHISQPLVRQPLLLPTPLPLPRGNYPPKTYPTPLEFLKNSLQSTSSAA